MTAGDAFGTSFLRGQTVLVEVTPDRAADLVGTVLEWDATGLALVGTQTVYQEEDGDTVRTRNTPLSDGRAFVPWVQVLCVTAYTPNDDEEDKESDG